MDSEEIPDEILAALGIDPRTGEITEYALRKFVKRGEHLERAARWRAVRRRNGWMSHYQTD